MTEITANGTLTGNVVTVVLSDMKNIEHCDRIHVSVGDRTYHVNLSSMKPVIKYQVEYLGSLLENITIRLTINSADSSQNVYAIYDSEYDFNISTVMNSIKKQHTHRKYIVINEHVSFVPIMRDVTTSDNDTEYYNVFKWTGWFSAISCRYPSEARDVGVEWDTATVNTPQGTYRIKDSSGIKEFLDSIDLEDPLVIMKINKDMTVHSIRCKPL